MFKPAYEEMGLAPRMLSRTLEDCGDPDLPPDPLDRLRRFMSSTLGISAFQYAPYAS
jgi:NhaC family Na+:H+ antiporter